MDPEYMGHRPLRILSMEDFPEPLGPMINILVPGLIKKLSLSTNGIPFGV
eukprot:TRINITY_DN10455_c0_g3_i1.p2 TRINITY_DN10455_c0_g3~~TRINITY_DN10455_c0_g3_i1.p2  ORF type:complete len:50 (+),score=7.18 TRINITY_DN10455_c0_g3_i1:75-224(+)